jgi:hypothetical protein
MTKRPSFRVRSSWLLAVTVLVASACERHFTVYVEEPAAPMSGAVGGATAPGGSGGASGSIGTGGARPDAGLPEAGASGQRGGAGAGAGGNASGDASVDVGSGDTGAECSVDADCPPPNRTCAVSRCDAGRCEIVNAPSGATVPNVPADCHASMCDGSGHATSVLVDRTNVPKAGPCEVAACDASGAAQMTPLAAGTACSAGPRTAMCDGAGTCVECNHSTDCPSGLTCDAHHSCASVPCTDLDCGGACAPCGLGKHCLADSDCLSLACDAATTTCIQDLCQDHRQDGNETDADCGGGTCVGCDVGQSCVLDADCKLQACDVATLKCISSQCADGRLDGVETDIDCGGSGGCMACTVGRGCKSNFDCVSGHFCNGGKVCQ